jgi:hypothetical protein
MSSGASPYEFDSIICNRCDFYALDVLNVKQVLEFTPFSTH